jgi:hypothetical protein
MLPFNSNFTASRRCDWSMRGLRDHFASFLRLWKTKVHELVELDPPCPSAAAAAAQFVAAAVGFLLLLLLLLLHHGHHQQLYCLLYSL